MKYAQHKTTLQSISEIDFLLVFSPLRYIVKVDIKRSIVNTSVCPVMYPLLK